MASHFYYGIKFDTNKLFESYLEIKDFYNSNDQIALQHLASTTENKHKDGIGWLDRSDIVPSDYLFNIWNEEIEDTYIIECLKSLPFPVVRSRIMVQPPKSCYTLHKDKVPRMHIPIYGAYDTTGKGGRFVFTHGEIMKFEEGQVILVNTTLEHTAMNCSNSKERIHIVSCLPELNESNNEELKRIYSKFSLY
tara:strand:+ start:5973 stop:6551 length:579 start_codon:yes stop_codon:yes gene_type:complete